MTSSQSAPPLVFVYLGNPPPKYARAAMTFAAGGHDGSIVLLTNSDHSIPPDPRYRVERIESWYDSSSFQSFRDNATLDSSFMNGFWYHVVERFFVLHQYMQKEKLDALFHGELDVMFFDLSGVATACDNTGTGIFAVMDDPSRALASTFYVNSVEKFEHFLQFALADVTMRNEMEMIGRYIQHFPESGHALPSSPFFEQSGSQIAPSMVPDSVGLFDGNPFGQWLFGLDPKTVKYVSRNHYRSEMIHFPIEKLRFSIPMFSRKLVVSMPGGPERQLRTIHVHSKIVRRLTVKPILVFYLWINSFSKSLVITRQVGWWASKTIDFLTGGVLWKLLKASFSLYPRPLSSLILWLARRAPVPMSNRQRSLFNQLLPLDPLRRNAKPITETWLVFEGDHLLKPEDLSRRLSDLNANSRVVLFVPSKAAKVAIKRYESWEIASFEDEEQLNLAMGERIFATTAATILVVRASREFAALRSYFDGKRQAIMFSAKKDDAATNRERGFWKSLDLRTELSFSDTTVLIRPERFREIYSNSWASFEEWIHSGPNPSLTFMYCAWMMARNQKETVLVRDLSRDNS